MTTSLVPRVYILGAGAIGLLHASALQLNSLQLCRPTLIMKPESLARFQAQQNKIMFRRPDLDPVTIKFDAISTKDVIQESIRYLIVATKAYDVIPAIQPFIPSLTRSLNCGQRSSILFLQNGALGVYDQVKKIFPHQDGPRIYLGSTTHGAFMDMNHFTLFHRGIGKTVFGCPQSIDSHSMTDHSDEFLNILLKGWESSLHGRIVSSRQILNELYTKLAVNCCINPTFAILDCKNGITTKLPRAREFIEQLVIELYPVIQEHIELSQTQLIEFVLDVAKNTAENENSMLVDLKRERPTEIDYLTGHLLHLAEKKRIDCPTHRSLFKLISLKEDIIKITSKM